MSLYTHASTNQSELQLKNGRPFMGRLCQQCVMAFKQGFVNMFLPKSQHRDGNASRSETGRVKDRPYMKVIHNTSAACRSVCFSTSSPQCLWKVSSEPGVPEATTGKHTKTDFGLEAYQPASVREFNDVICKNITLQTMHSAAIIAISKCSGLSLLR